LDWSLRLARRFSLDVHLVSVIDPLACLDATYTAEMAAIRDELDLQVARLVDELKLADAPVEITSQIRDGEPTIELAAVAEEQDACMVVVGVHQPGPIAGFIAGSVDRMLPPLLDCPMAAIPRS